MPNDYEVARAKRPTPRPKISATSPDDVRRAEIINRGGAFSDRIKIEPKYNAPPRKEPLPGDAEIQKSITSQRTQT